MFRSFADQDANLRAALQQLPPTLRQTQRRARAAPTSSPARSGPALQDLRPTARALGPTLRQTRPFLRETTPIIRDQLRPFARDVAADGQAACGPPRATSPSVTPDLVETFRVVNYLFNELAYNPPGTRRATSSGPAWANHVGALVFATQDAHGPIRRGTFLVSCSSARVLDAIIAADPRSARSRSSTGLPQSAAICPSSTQARRHAPTPPGATRRGGGG